MGVPRLERRVCGAPDVLRRRKIAVTDREIDDGSAGCLQTLHLGEHDEGVLRAQPLHPLRQTHQRPGSNTIFTALPSCRRAAKNASAPRDNGVVSTHGSVAIRPSENHWMAVRMSLSPAPYDPDSRRSARTSSKLLNVTSSPCRPIQTISPPGLAAVTASRFVSADPTASMTRS